MGSRSRRGVRSGRGGAVKRKKSGRRAAPAVVACAASSALGASLASGACGADGRDPAHEALAARVRAACAEALGGALQEGGGLRALCEAVEQSYAALDAMCEELDFQPPPACARGCIHCCFNQVSLTPPEALYLGMFVLERFGPERRAEVLRRAEGLLPLVRGRTRRELGDVRHLTPCVFLHQGACSVHPARPLVCRGWNSVDVAACKKSVEARDPLMPIENHALQRELADAVGQGLLTASASLGLEAGYLLLTRAARHMLVRGAVPCAEDWLSGGAFFAAAARN